MRDASEESLLLKVNVLVSQLLVVFSEGMVSILASSPKFSPNFEYEPLTRKFKQTKLGTNAYHLRALISGLSPAENYITVSITGHSDAWEMTHIHRLITLTSPPLHPQAPSKTDAQSKGSQPKSFKS